MRIFQRSRFQAPTVPERKREGGGTRERCTKCGKIAKESLSVAKEAAERIYQDKGERLRPYYSRRCGWWHLASRR